MTYSPSDSWQLATAESVGAVADLADAAAAATAAREALLWPLLSMATVRVDT